MKWHKWVDAIPDDEPNDSFYCLETGKFLPVGTHLEGLQDLYDEEDDPTDVADEIDNTRSGQFMRLMRRAALDKLIRVVSGEYNKDIGFESTSEVLTPEVVMALVKKLGFAKDDKVGIDHFDKQRGYVGPANGYVKWLSQQDNLLPAIKRKY